MHLNAIKIPMMDFRQFIHTIWPRLKHSCWISIKIILTLKLFALSLDESGITLISAHYYNFIFYESSMSSARIIKIGNSSKNFQKPNIHIEMLVFRKNMLSLIKNMNFFLFTFIVKNYEMRLVDNTDIRNKYNWDTLENNFTIEQNVSMLTNRNQLISSFHFIMNVITLQKFLKKLTSFRKYIY